jgi:hypothetical protein
MDSAPPAGFSSTAAWLVALLRPHTPFAEAIVKRQVERAGLALASLGQADLAKLGPMILSASAPFVDPPVLAGLKREIESRR